MRYCVPLVVLFGCTSPPHAIITVQDPDQLATNADRISVGNSLLKLESRDLEGGFPTTLSVVADKDGAQTIWVQAAKGSDVLGRGSTEVDLREGDTVADVVLLDEPCSEAAGCDDETFCNGAEHCTNHICVGGEDPCPPSPHACVNSTCLEAAKKCDIEVNHSVCTSTAAYCNLEHGCIPGQPCEDNDDCQDGYTCNGEEICDYRCVAGIPPVADDGDPCTIDACFEPEGVAHPINEQMLGRSCFTSSVPVDGICATEGCVLSVCGDGFVDPATGEDCEEANNDNPNDGCHDCRFPYWDPTLLVGGGASLQPLETNLYPIALASDENGVVFIGDAQSRLFQYDPSTQILTKLAGDGGGGFAGDGGPLAFAQFYLITDLATDGSNNLFIIDALNARVRRIGARSGLIDTYVGGGSGPYADGPARDASFFAVLAEATDGHGRLFLAAALDDGTDHLFRVDPTTDTITRLFGISEAQPPMSGTILALATDRDGNLLVVHGFQGSLQNQVSVVDETGQRTTIAGGVGECSPINNGVIATSIGLCSPAGLALDPAGRLLIANSGMNQILRVDTSTLTIVAGTGEAEFSGDGGPADQAEIDHPQSITVTPNGDLYIADLNNNRVRRVDSSGRIDTVAGTGADSTGFACSFYTDGASATSLPSFGPQHMAFDSQERLILAECKYRQVLRIEPDGVLTVIAGRGDHSPFTTDRPATQVDLAFSCDEVSATRAIVGLTIDQQDTIYVAEPESHIVSRIDASGILTTMAGNGAEGTLGEGGLATQAQLLYPRGLAVDSLGDLFISDFIDSGGARHDARVVRVDATTNLLTRVAGQPGSAGVGPLGDGGPATSAQLKQPTGITLDAAGNLYIADRGDARVRRVDASGIITTVVGNGTPGQWSSTNSTGATTACISNPIDVAIAGDTLFVLDAAGTFLTEHHVVYEVDLKQGSLRLTAGGGTEELGHGGPATGVSLYMATGIATDTSGNIFVGQNNELLFADLQIGYDFIRKIDRPSNTVSTIAGKIDPVGDGKLSVSRLSDPRALASAQDVLGTQVWLVADGRSGTVRSVDTDMDRTKTIVGYPAGNTGEGTPARYSRLLQEPRGIAVDPTGYAYVSEGEGHVIRRIDLTQTPWRIATFAGLLDDPGHADASGATSRFNTPAGLAFDPATRTLYVADSGNHAIRKINVDTELTETFAGIPRNRGSRGEGLPATHAMLNSPEAVTLHNGSVYIADTQNHRIRRVAPNGLIHTVLGVGTPSSGGEGSPARAYPVDTPLGLDIDSHGNLFVTSRDTIRVVIAGDNGIADGDDEVATIYGTRPKTYPASVTTCLTDLVVEEATITFVDRCRGFMVRLDRTLN